MAITFLYWQVLLFMEDFTIMDVFLLEYALFSINIIYQLPVISNLILVACSNNQ